MFNRNRFRARTEIEKITILNPESKEEPGRAALTHPDPDFALGRFLPKDVDLGIEVSNMPADFDVRKPTLPDPTGGRALKYSNRVAFDLMVARIVGSTNFEAGWASNILKETQCAATTTTATATATSRGTGSILWAGFLPLIFFQH